MNPIRQAKLDLGRIRAHGHAELAEKHQITLELLCGYQALGYPSSSQGTRGTGHADPTPAAAAAIGTDEIDRWLQRFALDLHRLATALDDLATLVALTRTLDAKQVADILRAERPTADTCTKCSKIVTQTRLDRTKLGLCPACYQADWRQRHPDGETRSEVGFQHGVVAS